jgi:hypothetical protein
VEYGSYQEAKDAVTDLQGKEILNKIVSADFAFSRGSVKGLKQIS